MGSPVSATIANLVMEFVEDRAISTAPHPPRWWYSEVEGDDGLSFLDTTTTRVNGRIQVNVYRKPTHTDKYLDFNSHHPTQHKRSVVNTLLERAKNIPSTSAGKRKEKEHVVKVLLNNNYPMRFIKSCDSHRKANRRVSDSSDTPNDAATSFVVLPYVKGVTERISKVLRNNGVKVGFKPLNTLRTRFPKPKDKLTAFQSRCVVYRVNCLDCNFTYYGQTDRALATRIKEHQRAVRVCDKNSKIAQHANTFGHDMGFNHAAVVDKSGDYHKRLFLEAWHSQRDQNAGNEHIDIPDVYK
ncbi:hypothetical protein ACROYT_G005298 [Oculina patagonica]